MFFLLFLWLLQYCEYIRWLVLLHKEKVQPDNMKFQVCLLYTSDAADE